MNISIFGLGYVGAVSAGCLSSDGHRVIGVDPNPTKVEMMNAGQSPIIEAGLAEKIARSVELGLIVATSDFRDAIERSALSFVCVATPSLDNGNLDLAATRHVCEQIGTALRDKTGFHSVVMRSSMLPGSMATVVIPTLELFSGRKVGVDLGVCYHPEFLREGTAVDDYYSPPKIVIGESDPLAGDQLAELYAAFAQPLIRTRIEVAEMVKYTDNCWHAMKVAFANEIGTFCRTLGVDGQDVMDIFCKDTKLNISPSYLRPGFAFGGSCLPKDVRALTYKARSLDLELPLLGSLLAANQVHVRNGIRLITAQGRKKVGVLGYSFKSGTDDLREAPMVDVIEHLLGKGYELRIYDRNVNLAALVGANRDYILNRVPHVSCLRVDSMQALLDFADVIVIGNNSPEFADVLDRLRPEQTVVDLARISRLASHGRYQGICW